MSRKSINAIIKYDPLSSLELKKIKELFMKTHIYATQVCLQKDPSFSSDDIKEEEISDHE